MEDRPSCPGRLDVDATAMQFDDRTSKRRPEAEPAVTPCAVRMLERIEDFFPIGGRCPASAHFNVDAHLLAGRRHRGTHDDATSLEVALIENMAREDLSPVEEARACAALVEELAVTREEVARRVGRSRVAVSNLIRLLDLPEEALELLQSGALSEGHGRALLLAEDHGVRKSLARTAALEGWSVRTTEARARASNAGAAGEGRRRRTASVHPDQEQAAQQIAEALASALGAEVQVRPTRDGGYRAQLSFATPQEALELARRLRRPAVV